MRHKSSILVVVLCLLPALVIAQKVQQNCTITYHDGKTQVFKLDQPSANIMRIDFGGSSTNEYSDAQGNKVQVPPSVPMMGETLFLP